MFQVKGIMNASVLEEIKPYMITTGRKGFIFSVIGLFIFAGLFCIAYGKNVTALVSFAGSAVLFLEYLYLMHKSIKTQLRRMKETYGKSEVQEELWFMETAVKVYNTESEGKIFLEYEKIKKVIETRHYITFMTREHQFFVVDKESIGEDQIPSFFAFLKEKCRECRFKELQE